MNKTVSIIFAVILSILTIFLTGVLIFFLNTDLGNINYFSFNFSDNYSTTLLDSKEYDVLKNIKVDSKVADVLIEESDNNNIVIELYSDYAKEYSITDNGDNINVVLNSKSDGISFEFKKSSKILIKLPSTYNKLIDVKSSVGDIKGTSFDKLSLNVINTTGDIKFDRLDNVTASITTGDTKIENVNNAVIKVTTGDIKINDIKSLISTTTTGDIKITNLNGMINSSIVTGDVKITSSVINDNSSINTKTGDVKIKSLKGAYIEANKRVGNIEVKNNDRKLDKEIKIETNVGDIKVNY